MQEMLYGCGLKLDNLFSLPCIHMSSFTDVALLNFQEHAIEKREYILD